MKYKKTVKIDTSQVEDNRNRAIYIEPHPNNEAGTSTSSGTIAFPDGSTKTPDGTTHYLNGTTETKNGDIIFTGVYGNVIGKGKRQADGSIDIGVVGGAQETGKLLSNGAMRTINAKDTSFWLDTFPDGTTSDNQGTVTKPDNTIIYSSGEITYPNHVTQYPSGNLKLGIDPVDNYASKDGAVYDASGKFTGERVITISPGVYQFPDGSVLTRAGIRIFPDGGELNLVGQISKMSKQAFLYHEIHPDGMSKDTGLSGVTPDMPPLPSVTTPNNKNHIGATPANKNDVDSSSLTAGSSGGSGRFSVDGMIPTTDDVVEIAIHNKADSIGVSSVSQIGSGGGAMAEWMRQHPQGSGSSVQASQVEDIDLSLAAAIAKDNLDTPGVQAQAIVGNDGTTTIVQGNSINKGGPDMVFTTASVVDAGIHEAANANGLTASSAGSGGGAMAEWMRQHPQVAVDIAVGSVPSTPSPTPVQAAEYTPPPAPAGVAPYYPPAPPAYAYVPTETPMPGGFASTNAAEHDMNQGVMAASVPVSISATETPASALTDGFIHDNTPRASHMTSGM